MGSSEASGSAVLRAPIDARRAQDGRGRPFWAVTRHADVMAVELDKANFLNGPRQFLVTRADEQMLVEQTGETAVLGRAVKIATSSAIITT